MADTSDTGRKAINPSALDEWLNNNGKNRQKLCEHLQIKYGTFNKRLFDDFQHADSDLLRIVSFIGNDCTADDICYASDKPIETPSRRRSSAKKSAETQLQILSDQSMTELYHRLGANNFVCVFSMDGFLESERQVFFNLVTNAVRKGLELFYFFPDSGMAEKSIQDFDDLVDKMQETLSDAEFKRVQAYFINAENKYVCTRASRFVLMGEKLASGERITTHIFIYIFSNRDYWIELTLDEHLAFLAELENSIDPVPYQPIRIRQELWHLPDLVKKRYQIAFGQESNRYSAVRQIVETKNSAVRIAEKADRHLKDSHFKDAASTLRWLDIGCQDGTNTAEIYDYLKA